MRADEKRELLNKAADKLKLASHFAEAYRKETPSAAQASTLWKLTGEANAAVSAYHHAMTVILPPTVG